MWDYRAAALRVIDGDTVVFLTDTGFHGRQEVELRLAEVSAPELNQLGGLETKAFVVGWIEQNGAPLMRWPFRMQTQVNTNPEPAEKRSFTRYIGWIHSFATSRSLNMDVIDYLDQHPQWGSGS